MQGPLHDRGSDAQRHFIGAPASHVCRPVADHLQMVHPSQMKLLEKEKRRLRRKYLRKTRHRGFSHSAYDKWLDWEYAKTAIPLAPALIAIYGGSPATITGALFWLGLCLSVFWFGFLTWTWVSIAARASDKQYMLITRKHLAKEYRE